MISLKLVKGGELAEGVRTEVQLPASSQRFVIRRNPAAHGPIPDRRLAIAARHRAATEVRRHRSAQPG